MISAASNANPQMLRKKASLRRGLRPVGSAVGKWGASNCRQITPAPFSREAETSRGPPISAARGLLAMCGV
eukprot:5042919-Amphidinium_carterae.1